MLAIPDGSPRLGLWVIGLVALAHLVSFPFSSIGSLVFRFVFGALALSLALGIHVMLIDGLAQLMRRRSALKGCFKAMAWTMWPFLVLVPINLLGGGAFWTVVVMWWVATLQVKALKPLYYLSSLESVVVWVFPGVAIGVGSMVMMIGFFALI